MKKIGRYLRELSIVIAGIAITFMVSDWISKQKEKKELQRSLEAVKIELQENLANIKEKEGFYEQAAIFANYLQSDKPENLNPDTLAQHDIYEYYQVSNYVFTLTYKTSAFEMLKTSGAINLIKNEALSRAILDCYAKMEEIKQVSDNYMSRKMDVLYQSLMKNQPDFDILAPQFREVLYFLAIYTNIQQTFSACSHQIETTLSLL